MTNIDSSAFIMLPGYLRVLRVLRGGSVTTGRPYHWKMLTMENDRRQVTKMRLPPHQKIDLTVAKFVPSVWPPVACSFACCVI